ncbi:DUF2510 domain-containing protein [Streptomyces sp. ISL-90]|nr:DUF2510 domain-containing protein [Streptomyces sp. ISL-90]
MDQTDAGQKPAAPAGWYPDGGSLGLRWWDGQQWTDHRAPSPPPAPMAGMVTLVPSQRRVPMGSLSDPEAAERSVSVPADSPEALVAGGRFDPSIRPPMPDELVPADCVWAYWPYPGPFPSDPARLGRIDQKFVAMGTLVGRHINEIHAAVGPAMVDVQQDGLRSVVWGRTSVWSGSWQINLVFDSYGVCARVGNQTRF